MILPPVVRLLCQRVALLRTKKFNHRATLVFRQFQTYSCLRGVTTLSAENPIVNKYMRNLLMDYEQCVNKISAINDDNQSTTDLGLVDLQNKVFRLKPVIDCYSLIENNRQDIVELSKMIKDGATEVDMALLAKKDVEDCRDKMLQLNEKLFQLLKPAEPLDQSDVILEVTAGVGGQEAMLFAKELFDMYFNYAEWKGWECELVDYQISEIEKGIRYASVSVTGDNVYSRLKFEGGVHRVQRIPRTEKAGRIHTSTVAVAILPQASQEEIKILPKDLKVDTKRSSGAGGQHVNTTESAIRVTHIPSGIVVECQTDRSQIKNRKLAIKKLEAKLFQKRYEDELTKLQSSRKVQIGTSGRSEKIRTYNFVQDRMTDHRCAINRFNLAEFMNGGPELDDLIESLSEEAKAEILLEMFSNSNF